MKWISIVTLLSALFSQEVCADHPPNVEELQAAARKALRDLPGLDRGEGVALTDHIPEQQFSSQCRGLDFIRESAVSLFRIEGFETVLSDLEFPQNSIVFIKPETGDVPSQKVVLYFSLEKSPYIECRYVVGAFAADAGRVSPVSQKKQTEAGNIAEKILNRLQDQIKRSELAPEGGQDGASLLKRYSVGDPILSAARNEAQSLLQELAPPALERTELLIVDLPSNSTTNLHLFRTRTCTSAYRTFSVPVVVCSGAFLRGVEAAVRRFEEGNDLISAETKLLAFVRNIEADPAGTLAELRRQDGDMPSIEEHIVSHLKIALVYFAGHELGHLIQRMDGRSFRRNTMANSLPDREIRADVINLCKHVNAFVDDGFGLHGFGGENGVPFWSERVRQIESEFRNEIAQLQDERDALWELEVEADRVGTDLILRLLEIEETGGLTRLLEAQHLLIETVFVIGLTSWYRDLANFLDSSCGANFDSRALNFCFSDRSDFVAAGHLFGDVHRHLLLRSLQILREVIGRRKLLFEESFIPGNEINSAEDLQRLLRTKPLSTQREMWRLGDLQRFNLLAALMDTPLKLAYAGCASGWYSELKATDGPQRLSFDFYRIEDEIARLFGASQDLGKHEQDLDDDTYVSWFSQVLRLTRQPSGLAPSDHDFFIGQSREGTANLKGVEAPFHYTFYCEYSSKDPSPEKRECFNNLLRRWLRFLSAQQLDVKLVLDATVPGWIRRLYSASYSDVEQFRFIFESEVTGSQSMGYSKIRIELK